MAEKSDINKNVIIDTHVHIFNAHQVGLEVILTLIENSLKKIVRLFKRSREKEDERERPFEVAGRIATFIKLIFTSSHCILRSIENLYKDKKKLEKREKKGVCKFIPLTMDPEYGMGFKDPDIKRGDIKAEIIKNIKNLDEQIRIELQERIDERNKKSNLNITKDYEMCMKKLYHRLEISGVLSKEREEDHIVCELKKIYEIISDNNRSLGERIKKTEDSMQIMEQIIQVTQFIELIKDINEIFSHLLPVDIPKKTRNFLHNRLGEYQNDLEEWMEYLQENDKGNFQKLFEFSQKVSKQINSIPPDSASFKINEPAKKIGEYMKLNETGLEEVKVSGDVP